MKKIFILTVVLINSVIYGQALYTLPGGHSSMLRIMIGDSKYGKLNNFQAGFSYKGKLDGSISYNAATYRVDGLTRNFLVFGLEYFLFKGVKEGDWITGIILNYAYGKFRGTGSYDGTWDKTGTEIEPGIRLGQRMVEGPGYVFIPSLEYKYYWQQLKFVDYAHNEEESWNDEGYRLVLRFDNVFVYKPNVSFTFTPVFQYNGDVFVYALDVGFVWGKVQ